jgi:hypothetical protein
MQLVSVVEAAQRLGVSRVSLRDKRYRARIGLPAIKIGRRIGFADHDLEQLMIRAREELPMRGGTGGLQSPKE